MVVDTAAADAQGLGLLLDGKIVLGVDHRFALRSPALVSAPSSRVEDWRITVGSGGSSIAFALDLIPAAVVLFPAPASSNGACGFPALRFPVTFMARLYAYHAGCAFGVNRLSL